MKSLMRFSSQSQTSQFVVKKLVLLLLLYQKMASLVELTEGVVTEPRLVSPALFKAAVLAIVNG
jgi:hypothetical protein